MPLSAGTRLGPHEILSAIGAGGMGEVYKARDTRLDRMVAIKVIRGPAAADPEFRERFEREARAVSALDHPHICTLYDVGHDEAVGGADYLVMQYLEGETLADRLARTGKPRSDPSRPSSAATDTSLSTISRGPIPLETTLRHAAEIADALDAAHRRGIVHRDLKPGNVMLTRSGTKLLDFGLAKLAAGPLPVAGDATRTSPLGFGPTSPLTGQGAILGTLYYMSPEQLEGREVDARSDVFSFGALLHEMLTGRRAFERESQAGTIAAIIGDDAPELGDLADVRARLPVVARRALERLLARCLAKAPEDRWQSAGDLAAELRWIDEERLRNVAEAAGTAAAPVAPASRTRERAWMAAAIAALAAAATLGWAWYPRPQPVESITFTIDPPEGLAFANGPALLAVSSDGRRLAFVVGEGEERRIWIRSFDSLVAQELDRTEHAWNLTWSPDDRFIAFAGPTSQTALRKVDPAVGTPQTLAPAGSRAAWSSDGTILYGGRGGRLNRVPDTGGQEPELVVDLDESRQETAHNWPTFLPDGRRFVFATRSRDPSKHAIFLASLDAPGRTRLLDGLSNVEYAKGHLFYQREGTLLAHPFDADSGRLTGDPIALVEGVQFNEANGRAAFSVSPTGVLAYRKGNPVGRDSRSLAWFDRSGALIGTVGPEGNYADVEISPEGRRAVVAERDDEAARTTLVLLDLDRGVPSRFTVGEHDELNPIWSRDGEFVVFNSVRDGKRGIYRRAAGGGATTDELVYDGNPNTDPLAFSPDGKHLLFVGGTGQDARIWALPMTGDRTPFEVFKGSTTRDIDGQFSTDGKWIAYTSVDPSTAVGDVYVQPFPADGRRIRISTEGGSRPRWSPNGRRLYYRSRDDMITAVDLTFVSGTVRPGMPQPLFSGRRPAAAFAQFATDPSGERFLLVVRAGQAVQSLSEPITVVTNVEALLRR